MSADPRVKQLKIKTGVLKRLAKEKICYEEEGEKQKARIEKMKTDPTKDEYDIRKQHEVLNETLQMGPDCIRRIKQANTDLQNLVDESEADLKESKEFQDAIQVLADVKAQEAS